MTRTVVVGAGAIGLACAYALRKRGREVVVVDQGEPGAACTKGNAGWITPSISAPIPAPGLTWTSLRWMLDPDSPLYIAPRAAPRLAGWLWRFWRHCNHRDFVAGLRAVAGLNRGTLAAFDQLERDGLRFELHRDGILSLFLDRRYLTKVLAEFEHYQEFGYRVPEPLGGDELRRLEPGLSRGVTAGFLVEREYHVRPETLVTGYVDRLRAMGVDLRAWVRVTGGIVEGGRVTGLATGGGPVPGDEFVIAAGAWTGLVIERFGPRLPVQAGKGYSITVERGGPRFSRPLYLGEARIGCSPFAGGVRYAGTMELSGINTDLDRRRVVGIRRGIGRYLAEPLGPDTGEEWVGMRPLTPDGLPVLGPMPGLGNLHVATGHAMLGVTLAPVTGEAVADLLTGVPRPDLAAFRPERFGRRGG